MDRLSKLDVYYHDFRVGTMALHKIVWQHLNMIETGLLMDFL